MQFGRFHGFALLALGALLLLVQTYVIFESRASSPRPVPEQPSETTGAKAPSPQPKALDYLPGLMGLVLVGLGGVALVQYQRKIIERADAREKIAQESASHYNRPSSARP